jgi:NitT/TauT family transport system substrate-binding protein
LSENGVDYNAVNWVEVQFPQHADVIRSGQVDAAVMVDPFFARAVEQKVGYAAAEVYAKTPDGTMLAAYVSTTEWLSAHPKECAEFRAALEEGRQFVAANKDSALQSLSKYTKLLMQALETMAMPNLTTKAEMSGLTWWIQAMQKQKLFAGQPGSALIAD